jgi:hypothetical protein
MKIVKDWYKSSASTAANNCVEVRVFDTGAVDVRNSKDPQGSAVHFTRDEWAAFVTGAKGGEFDTV